MIDATITNKATMSCDVTRWSTMIINEVKLYLLENYLNEIDHKEETV